MVLWHTVGPRISAVYDLMGNGTNGAQVGDGRYYYVIAGGRRRARWRQPERPTTRSSTTGTTSTAICQFQPGEQTGTPVISREST